MIVIILSRLVCHLNDFDEDINERRNFHFAHILTRLGGQNKRSGVFF